MNVGTALYIDEEIDRLSNAVTRIEDRLKSYFETRSYGDDVDSLCIGLILTGPGSERLHPVRPFKYRRKYTLNIRELKQKIYMGNLVEFDVKPDYSKIRMLNSENAEHYIIGALIEGIGVLAVHQKKFPNFDVLVFSRDFSACLSPRSAVPP